MLARTGRTIGIVHPAHVVRGGNHVTASRWAGILARLGHAVFLEETWNGRECDVLLALHARRSHASIVRFFRERRGRALLVAATGTDIYGDEPLAPESLESFRCASRIVVLQPRAIDAFPAELRPRVRVIHQSVEPPRERPSRAEDAFEVATIAHLRPVKDPLLPAIAARALPPSSRIRVVLAGGLIDDRMQPEIDRELRLNPRFRWLGELSGPKVLGVLARSRLFVSSSRHEGGSNAVSEALALGVPVLATRIPGSIGLLGEGHPGLYEAGDAPELADLMRRAETDATFLRALEGRSRSLASLTDPARELERWRALLAEVL